MTESPKVALVTCAAVPQLDQEDASLIEPLAQMGVRAEAAVWDDPGVDWEQYGLVVVRSVWDFAARRTDFLAWANGIPNLVNSPAALKWSSDKHYLLDLERAGIPVVPTTWLEPDRGLSARGLHTRFPSLGDFVIKPAVSSGALDTGRYTSADASSRGLAIRHGLRLLNSGRTAMVQRYVQSVDVAGETGMVFIDGAFSHSVHKRVKLTGPDVGNGYQLGKIERSEPTDAQIQVAEHALSVAWSSIPTAPGDFVFAQVDLVTSDDGSPMILELDLVDPTLFVSQSNGAAQRAAKAIAARCRPI